MTAATSLAITPRASRRVPRQKARPSGRPVDAERLRDEAAVALALRTFTLSFGLQRKKSCK